MKEIAKTLLNLRFKWKKEDYLKDLNDEIEECLKFNSKNKQKIDDNYEKEIQYLTDLLRIGENYFESEEISKIATKIESQQPQIELFDDELCWRRTAMR